MCAQHTTVPYRIVRTLYEYSVRGEGTTAAVGGFVPTVSSKPCRNKNGDSNRGQTWQSGASETWQSSRARTARRAARTCRVGDWVGGTAKERDGTLPKQVAYWGDWRDWGAAGELELCEPGLGQGLGGGEQSYCVVH